MPIDPLNPGKVISDSTQFGWAVFVLVIVLILYSLREYLVYMKVTIPESDARRDMMAKWGAGSVKTGDAMEVMAANHTQYVSGLKELKESQSSMTAELQAQGQVGRKLMRCARVLCEMHEHHDTANAKQYAQRMLDILSEQ